MLCLCFPFLPKCRRKCFRIRARRDDNILVCCHKPFLSTPPFRKSHRKLTYNPPALRAHIVRKSLSSHHLWGGRAMCRNQDRTRVILWLVRYQPSCSIHEIDRLTDFVSARWHLQIERDSTPTFWRRSRDKTKSPKQEQVIFSFRTKVSTMKSCLVLFLDRR